MANSPNTTTASRRVFLAAGSAGAVFGALASAAAAPSDLDSLIAAHKGALAEFHDAIDALQAAEDAFKAAHPKGFLIHDGLGAYFDGLVYSREEIKGHIGEAFDRERRRFERLEILAPGASAPAIAALAEKEAQAIAAVDEIFERECGAIYAADRRRDEANESEENAALAVCAYPCATIEEARRKAGYASTIPSIADSGDDLAMALLQSFSANVGA